MLEEKKISMLKFAMSYGMYLGLFWAFKYLLLIAEQAVPSLIYLYYLLNGGTFLLIYIYYFRFRDADPERQQSTVRCIGFVISLCFFASFFEAIVVFLHIQVIDPAYFATRIEPTLKAMLDIFPYTEEQRMGIMAIATNRLVYIFSVFTSNIFVGSVLGILFSLIIGNKKR